MIPIQNRKMPADKASSDFFVLMNRRRFFSCIPVTFIAICKLEAYNESVIEKFIAHF